MTSVRFSVPLAVAVLGLTACTGDTQVAAEPLATPPASPSSGAAEAERCDAVPPTVLPSGAATGDTQTTRRGFAWGTGRDRVEQTVGNPLEIGEDWPQRVAFRGDEAMLVPIGDPGQIAVVFTVNRCTYTT